MQRSSGVPSVLQVGLTKMVTWNRPTSPCPVDIVQVMKSPAVVQCWQCLIVFASVDVSEARVALPDLLVKGQQCVHTVFFFGGVFCPT